MRDCDKVEVRDLLPDLLDAKAPSAELARAREHVAVCDTCRAELALLRAVRAAAPAPSVDVARIGAAIPAYRPVPAWRRVAQAPAFRMAAALLLMVGVGSVVIPDRPERAAPDTALASRDAGARSSAGSPSTAAELPLGAPLSELSESDLRALLSELGDLQAVTPTDADVVVIPALDRNGA